jgi:NAD(P)-dependent dehydrogenase (short-subunit alcohol dehydrogenase family)
VKIIVIGATGTIGSEVVKALSLHKHEVIRASRNDDVRVMLDDPASVRALFESLREVDAVVVCAGNDVLKPFADLTDADYEVGLRSKLMGQVSVARFAKDRLRDNGSITLTTSLLAMHPMVGSASASMISGGLEGFVRAAALEMPRGLRINAVSPPWVKETMVKYGMDPTPGLAASDVAKAYVAAVEGSHQGKIRTHPTCAQGRGRRARRHRALGYAATAVGASTAGWRRPFQAQGISSSMRWAG